MKLLERLRERARAHPARVVLPEGDDPRVVRAAAQAISEGVAHPILLGDQAEVTSMARQCSADLARVPCIDPRSDSRREGLRSRYQTARREAAPTEDEARLLLLDPIYFGTMLVEAGEADGLLAGAHSSTSRTIEPALKVRRLHPGMGPIASCFIMQVPTERDEAVPGGVLVFTDCALNPEPSPAMLAQIAIAGARVARELCQMEPRVALLSFSTRGSAEHERVDKVRQALAAVKKRAPELTIDGELQADAALVASVGALKAPGSPVAGQANVLVFPSLEAGNIAYKLVERLAGARAIGPIFSGLNWPINDLSRGCSVDDIIDMLAVTSIQAHAGRAGRGPVS
jgi:phosphate acetyltransferase